MSKETEMQTPPPSTHVGLQDGTDWTEVCSAMTAKLQAEESTPPPSEHVAGDQHPDDLAVDRFAAAMKAKLAQKRAEGRGGWDNPDECSIEWLSELLRSHVEKADPVDVGNFAMMIHQRGGRICK